MKTLKHFVSRFSFRSSDYWGDRYTKGGNSGSGSYGRLAEFKGQVLNEFVKKHSISTVMEFGCGDGNQLRYFNFPSYLGFDVAEEAILLCRNAFTDDAGKRFEQLRDYSGEKAELTISLDVIYHLVEDCVFEDYMRRLFDSANRFVCIYSSNYDGASDALHVKHRNFLKWIGLNRPDWVLFDEIKNPYPLNSDPQNETFADFYFFRR